MTVESPVAKIVHEFNRAVVEYPFNFKVFKERELLVEYVFEAKGVPLALGLDYTVPPAGLGVDAGGKVILTGDALERIPDGVNLVLSRSMLFTQEEDYTPHSTFPAEILEKNLDILTMMCQELRGIMGRALLAPPDAEKPLEYSMLEKLYEDMQQAILDIKNLLDEIVSSAEGTISDLVSDAEKTLAGQALQAKEDVAQIIAEAQELADNLFYFLTYGRPNFVGDWTAGRAYMPNDLVRGPDGLFWLFTKSHVARDFEAETADKTLIAWGVSLGSNENNHQRAWVATEAVAAGEVLNLAPFSYTAGRESLLFFHNNIPCYPKGESVEFQYEEIADDPGGLSFEIRVFFDIAVGDHIFVMDVASAFTAALDRVEGLEQKIVALADKIALDAVAAAESAAAVAASAERAEAAESGVAASAAAAEAAKDAAAQEALKAQGAALAAANSADGAGQAASQADMYRGMAKMDSDSARVSAQAAQISMNNAANNAANAADEADLAAAQAAAGGGAKNAILATLADGIDASMIRGVLDDANIPESAKEVREIVDSEEARLLLTIDDVQNNDTVNVLQGDGTVKQYLVIDDSLLSPDGTTPGDETAFREYYVAAVYWEQIKNKPDLIVGSHAASHARGGGDELTPAMIGAAPNQTMLSEQAPTSSNLTLTNTGVATKFQQARNVIAYLLSYIDSEAGVFPIAKGGTGGSTAEEAALNFFPGILEETAARLAAINSDGTLSGTVSAAALAKILSKEAFMAKTLPWIAIDKLWRRFTENDFNAETDGGAPSDPLPPLPVSAGGTGNTEEAGEEKAGVVRIATEEETMAMIIWPEGM